ncbi:MAG: SGNH/GDSL hydrolase family protein [Austwickia sp.]|nr:MAG: SGNH/GDSL hydrolase family protein [Austwickia sp.]
MSAPYVALGDSFSAGIGSDTAGTQIRREGGFPVLLARDLGMDLAYQAFIGATVDNVLLVQLGPLATDTALVTLTVGGNDAGFVPVLIACAQPAWLSDGLRTLRTTMAHARRELPDRLDRLYRAIRDRAPDARVVVADYPDLFAGVDCQALTFFSSAEMAAINAAGAELSGLMADAAARHGAHFVSVRSTYAGHELCRPEPWLHGLSWPVDSSFHPTTRGHAAYAQVIGPVARDVGPKAPAISRGLQPAGLRAAGRGPRVAEGPRARGSGGRFRLPDLLAPQNLDAAERHGLNRAEVADLAARIPRGQRAVAPDAPPPDPDVVARLRELDARVRRRTGRP